jgi:hypothetical protein
VSYGLNDAADERRAQALEAQASDIERVAATLESTQPQTALSLRNQVAAMRQQSSAFRQASGLQPPGSWPLWTKVVTGVGVVAGAVWLLRSRGTRRI